MLKRASGILLPVSSLPGPWGIGTLGKDCLLYTSPGYRGIAIYTQQQFDDLIGCANNHGMQVAVHTIGRCV